MKNYLLSKSLRPIPSSDLMRIGRANDGGYVVSAATVLESDYLISAGINDDWSFESAFLSRHGVEIPMIAIDYSISIRVFFFRATKNFVKLLLKRATVKDFLDSLKVPFRYLAFFRKKNLHLRKKLVGTAGGVGEISLQDLFTATNSKKIFLKIDIEGGEYELLSTILKHEERLTSAVIEFHDCNSQWDKIYKFTMEFGHSHELVHVHVNNFGGSDVNGFPNVIEITFASRNLISYKTEVVDQYPRFGLDSPNSPRYPDLEVKYV